MTNVTWEEFDALLIDSGAKTTAVLGDRDGGRRRGETGRR